MVCDNKIMMIFVAADHAGFQMKEDLKKYLADLGYEVKDMGAFELNPGDDYPDLMFPMAKAVAENLGENKGIAVCGSGQGEAMAANKVRGIRAAVVYDEYSARMSRQDNDANIMALGARTLDIETAKRLVRMWLETPFSGEERHIRRIKKIAEEEKT